MKKSLKIISALLIATLIVGGWFVGKRLLRRFNEHTLTTSAQSFFEKRDFRSASLAARQALNLNPNNIEATRLMARMSGETGAPDVVLWKRRLTELEPGNTLLLEDLAVTAAQFNDIPAATQALAQVKEPDRNTVAYHEAAATVATSTKNYSEAVSQFGKALALEPQNKRLQYNVAALQLQSANATEAAAARQTLESLQETRELRLPVLRALLSDARRRGDFTRAMQVAAQIDQDAEATMIDHLLYMEELLHANDPSLAGKLQELGEKTGLAPKPVYQYITWMNAHGMAAQSIAWIKKQPAGFKLQDPVPLALAEACGITQDWDTLRLLTAGPGWGGFDFMRFAFRARLVEQTQQAFHGSQFRVEWDRAVTATGGDSYSISLLAQMAESWGWQAESAQLWWIIAHRKFGQLDALRRLNRLYTTQKKTRELYKVFQRLHEITPEDRGASNNLAYFSLLLIGKDFGQDIPLANQIAEANHKADPSQPVFATTYAFSLYKQQRIAEALDLMKTLPDAVLRQPSVAAFYGTLLATSGDAVKAREFLKIAMDNRQQLLPEEADMADKAFSLLP